MKASNIMAPFLEMRSISKAFSRVSVLADVNLKVNHGEILGLVGENGAGKSTLMNILAGVVQKDQGEILMNGQEIKIRDPLQAQKLGIAFNHQELNLFPTMNIMENVFISSFPRTTIGLINHKETRLKTEKLLELVGLSLGPETRLQDLNMSERQLVEVIKALAQNAQIIIFDEPTSSLCEREAARLFQIMRSLKEKGMALLYISHHLDEVLEVCDRITVLRNGRISGEVKACETNSSELVKMMVGREVNLYPKQKVSIGKEVFSVEGVARREVLKDTSFYLRCGEILGLAGLAGAGRSDLARCLFGLDRFDRGAINFRGRKMKKITPRLATRLGLGFLTEDRRGEGLVLNKSIRENITMASLDKIASRGLKFIIHQKETRSAQEIIKQLNIVPPDPELLAGNLSGGNQQKIVIGKWLLNDPAVYIFDQPTRGVDVGAKAEIHQLMVNLAERGSAIILISSEIEEIMNMSDRILVMFNGEIRCEFDHGEASKENILHYATGGI